jgi:hypothetical protein
MKKERDGWRGKGEEKKRRGIKAKPGLSKLCSG